MKITPIHLQILLHHYTTAETWEPLSDTHTEYKEELRQHGLLSFKREELAITDKGRYHIEQILELPLPTQRWIDHKGMVISTVNKFSKAVIGQPQNHERKS